MCRQQRLCNIGKNIRNFRLKKGFSQEVLAEKSELSREHISCIECGKYPITIINLYKISDALDIDIKDLL